TVSLAYGESAAVPDSTHEKSVKYPSISSILYVPYVQKTPCATTKTIKCTVELQRYFLAINLGSLFLSKIRRSFSVNNSTPRHRPIVFRIHLSSFIKSRIPNVLA